MGPTIVSLLFVIFVATIVSINAAKNEDLMDYAERLTQLFGIIVPVETLKRLPKTKSDDLNHVTSQKCAEQMNLFVEGLRNSSVWAFKMADASSKIPTGVLMGNVMDLGSFDECVEIEVQVGDNDIRGQHCMYDLSVGIGAMKVSVLSSVCMPASCSPEDVQQIVQSGVQTIEMWQSNLTATVSGTTCSPIDPEPWTFGGIATVVGLALLLSFLVVCTIVDVFARYSNEESQPNTLIHTIRDFSLLTNAERILTTKTSPETLPTLQGLRFWSMCWVIIGHSHILFFMNSANIVKMFEWMVEWKSVYIMSGPFSVDTFFSISGFLMCYLFLKEMSTGRDFNLFSYYLHRYLRLTPAFAALLLIALYISPRLGSGPNWHNAVLAEQESCRNGWWTMLLYVQNYVIIKPQGCLGHTWYLAAEMHFFWLSPLILYPLAKKPKIGLGILVTLLVAAIAVPIKIGWDNKYSTATIVNSNFSEDAMNNFYFKSHVRAVPWLVGVLFGYLVFTGKGTSTRRVIKWIGWLVATASFLFCILAIRIFQDANYDYNEVWEACYTALARPCWSFLVLWITFASIRGFGGPVKTFLSLPIYTPISRISYCVYLVHYQIQFIKVRALRVPNYFSPFNAIDHFCTDFMMSIIVGFVFTLVFESPFAVLEKKFLRRNARTRNNGKQVTKMEELEKGISNPGLTMS